jgi:hypothetical protein
MLSQTADASQPNPPTPADARKEQASAVEAWGQVQELSEALADRRFQVALAVFPELIGMGVIRLDDENQPGACARVAFEYADAFIAQSKKGQGDGEA